MPSHERARFEDAEHDFVMKEFGGVNTQASRTAIAENEFSWLENLMPVGHANLRCVPLQSGILATIPSGTVTYWQYANVSNVDYLIVATSTSAMFAINLSTYAITSMAGGGIIGPITIAQWKNERVLIIGSNGYWSWEPVGGFVALGGITGAPANGNTIATFAGRVWISTGRTITFSAPNSYQDFTTASSGGSFIITDSVLHSNVNAMVAANNFLYIYGDSSINVVSDVRVGTGSPAPTLYSNTNISALIGSTLQQSVFTFYRSIGFATRYGFYALTGATPQKISDKLDNIFPLIDFTKPVTGGVANIFNILCPAFLFNYQDPAGARPLMAVMVGDKWFFCSQGNGLTMIGSAFKSGTPVLYGTDGSNLYQLFFDTASAISTKAQFPLWNFKRPTSTKQVLKAGLEVTLPSAVETITATIDTTISSIPITFSGSNTGDWINAAGTIGKWVNNAATQGSWIAAGFSFFQSNVEAVGRYVGMTITSTSPGYTLNGAALQYKVRGNWNPL